MKAFLSILACCILLLSGPHLMAQTGEQADVESIRIAFLTKRLALTPDEAKVFWPVYNQYQSEIWELKKAQREEVKDARQNFDLLSDSEVEQLVDDMVSLKQQETQIFLRYHEEFKKVLPIRKVAKLYRSEQEFTRMLLERLNQRRQEGMQQRGGRMGGRMR